MTIILSAKMMVIIGAWGAVLLMATIFGIALAPDHNEAIGCTLGVMAFTAFIITVCAALMM